MSNKEMAADLAKYFKANGFGSVKLIDNDEKVVVENFGDCRLQLEPKASKEKVRLCAYATSNREKWKEFFKEHRILSNDVINRKKDGDSGVVRESFMILEDDWEGVKKRVYDECVKMKKLMKDMEGEWPSGGGFGGKECRDDLSGVDEAVLKECFQTYLGHKKLLDLIRVCQEDTLSRAENKKWTNDECNDAVARFQEKVKNIDNGLSKYLDCNLFDILRMGEHEIRHSNMLAWLLDATETHRMGNEFLSSFLNEVVEVAKSKGNGVCEGVVKMVAEHDFGDMSDYKVFREDEHEDIKLMSESAKTIVVIENKWNAEAGENQLTKYRERTDAECKDYGAGWEAIYVFLTKDGECPEKDDDDHWIPISYRQIITMVLDLYGRMAEGSAQKMIVDQYLQVLKRDADLIQQDDQVVQDVKKFCKDCDAIRFLPFVGEEYFQRVFDGLRNRDKRQWVRDEELDAGRGTCIVFFCEELRLQLAGARYEYCLELELDRTYSRVCCNLLRKVGGKKKREAVRWNCAKNEHGEPIQKTNVKNWKKFDINSTVPARMLEHMAENAIASVIEEVSRGVKCGPEIVDKW